MPIILAIANLFGISVFRLVAYISAIIIVIIALGTVRQHYINVGWYKHAAKIEKQDNAAIAVDKKVEQDAQKCSDDNGFWDVLTQGCKLQDAEESK